MAGGDQKNQRKKRAKMTALEEAAASSYESFYVKSYQKANIEGTRRGERKP